MEFLSTIAATIASGVWSVVSALLILVIAFVVAAVVKSAVVKLLGKGRIGQILDKMDSPGGGSTRDFIGKLLQCTGDAGCVCADYEPAEYGMGLCAQYCGGSDCADNRILYCKDGASAPGTPV